MTYFITFLIVKFIFYGIWENEVVVKEEKQTNNE